MIFNYPALPDGVDVSRETLERLQILLGLVEKWNRTINLVSPSTLAEGWHRHVADSAQLFALCDRSGTWLDIGSGAGFPGLVTAVIAAEKRPSLSVTLVESDARKCVFLREASRKIEVAVTVQTARIEKIPPVAANVMTARALAPISDLLAHGARHLSADGVALLMKGRNAASEIAAARKTWNFDYTSMVSVTDPEAVILSVRRIVHV